MRRSPEQALKNREHLQEEEVDVLGAIVAGLLWGPIFMMTWANPKRSFREVLIATISAIESMAIVAAGICTFYFGTSFWFLIGAIVLYFVSGTLTSFPQLFSRLKGLDETI